LQQAAPCRGACTFPLSSMALRGLGEWAEHLKTREGWEIGREVNPIHKIFWVDMAFFLGLVLCATWQTWDYAMYKARNGNKGYLFSGAHHLWRIVLTCVLAVVLILTELAWPGRTSMHYVAAFAMFCDAALLYLHTEKMPMPVLFPFLEAILTIFLAFGVSDKGRLTSPIILMIASFRFAAELWPLKMDEDCFKIVSAVLMAALGWHWFPFNEAVNLWNVAKSEQNQQDNEFNNYVDMLFCFNLLLGHCTVLGILWKILPQFFSNELAYERQNDVGGTKGVEIGAW